MSTTTKSDTDLVDWRGAKGANAVGRTQAIAVAFLLLTGCSQPAPQDDNTTITPAPEPGVAEEVEPIPNNNPWRLIFETDELTGARTEKLVRSVPISLGEVELSASCKSTLFGTNMISFQISSFDRNGDPLQMTRRADGQINMRASQIIGEAIQGVAVPTHINSAMLDYYTDVTIPPMLKVELPFLVPAGESQSSQREVIDLHVDDALFRQTIGACLQRLADEAAARKANSQSPPAAAPKQPPNTPPQVQALPSEAP